MTFANRGEGGRVLAERLRSYARRSDVVVVALVPRAVPVAYEIAVSLGAQLDVFRETHELGAPVPGALGSGGAARSSGGAVERFTRRCELRDKVVILVDDGITAPHTVVAAARALRRRPLRRFVVALPVAVRRSVAQLVPPLVDDLVIGVALDSNRGMHACYRDAAAPSEDEVRMLLDRAAHAPTSERDLTISIGSVNGGPVRSLRATLAVPADPRGVVILARGPAAHTQASRRVAADLRDAGFATLLVDLLTDDERRARALTAAPLPADHIARTARRLDIAIHAALQMPELFALPLALCFLGEDAAQRVLATARRVHLLRAVLVSGPRVVPVANATPLAPTLIVAAAQPGHVLPRGTGVAVVLVPPSGASVDEPVPLSRVASLARDWFTAHIAAHESWATM